jgi:hypothetical protein
MELLRELIETDHDDIDALPLMEALEESIRSLNLQQKGGKVDSAIAGAKDFFKANPGLVAGAAVLAVSALQQYRKNQRNTIKLHAKTAYEKKMMTSIADALVKDGKFKIHRIKFEGGGKSWILKRKWS